MAPLHIHPQGNSRGQHSFLHSTYSHERYLCFPWALSFSNLIVLSQGKKSIAVGRLQRNRMHTGWEGNGVSKTVPLTLFLTCIWLWVLHYATLIEFPCNGVTRICARACSVSRLGGVDRACLLGDFSTESIWGSDIPTEMTGLQSSKAPLNSLYVAKFIYFEDINPLQPRGRRRARAATRRWSVCHDLAFPETLGKLSETAQSSALDQVANYKTDRLCMHTWFTWRLTAGLMGFVLCTNISWFSNDH